MFQCDVLIEEHEVVIVVVGDAECVDLDWIIDTVVEVRERAADIGAPVVLDLRHARLDRVSPLDAWMADLNRLCAVVGVALQFLWAEYAQPTTSALWPAGRAHAVSAGGSGRCDDEAVESGPAAGTQLTAAALDHLSVFARSAQRRSVSIVRGARTLH